MDFMEVFENEPKELFVIDGEVMDSTPVKRITLNPYHAPSSNDYIKKVIARNLQNMLDVTANDVEIQEWVCVNSPLVSWNVATFSMPDEHFVVPLYARDAATNNVWTIGTNDRYGRLHPIMLGIEN